jgi:hypothetical protein
MSAVAGFAAVWLLALTVLLVLSPEVIGST